MFFVASLLTLIIKGLLPFCPCSDWPNSLSLSGLLECKVALNASSWSSESYLDFSRISVMMQAVSGHCFSHQEVMPSSHTKAGEQMSVVHSRKVVHFWVTWLRRKNEGRSSHIQLFLQQNLETWALGGSCCSLKAKQPSLLLECYWCSLVSKQLETSSWTGKQSRKQFDFWWPEVKFEQR